MQINKKFLNNMSKGNLVINAGLCLGSIAVFGFNPVALCACFIGSDLLLMLANEIVTKSIAKKIAASDDFNVATDGLREFAVTEDDSKEFERSRVIFDEARKAFLKEKKELEEKQIAEEKRKEEEEKRLIYNKVRGLDSTMEAIERFQEMRNAHKEEWTGEKKEHKRLKKLAKEFDRLKDNLEKKPESGFIVGGMFTIYTSELLKYTETADAIPETQKAEFDAKYVEILNEFIKYVQDINDRIEAFTVSDAAIGLDTLLSELREVNKTRTTESNGQ